MDNAPNREKADHYRRVRNPRNSETQSRPQQEWHQGIKKSWAANPAWGHESEIRYDHQSNEHQHDFEVVSYGLLSGLEDHVRPTQRSEEHTSELQSRFDLVCRLLLEKKKTKYKKKV